MRAKMAESPLPARFVFVPPPPPLPEFTLLVWGGMRFDDEPRVRAALDRARAVHRITCVMVTWHTVCPSSTAMGNPPIRNAVSVDNRDVQAEVQASRREAFQQHAAWLRRQPNAHVIIVTGGRDYPFRDRVFAALDAVHAKKPITLLVHGGAPGADSLADEWGKERGVWRQVFEADWRTLGPKAGPERNQRMVDAGANGAVAFPGGRGTADCSRRCEVAGIKVWRPFG